MNIPLNFEYANLYNSQFCPSTVHCSNTGLVQYFYRYLLHKAISVFKINGQPDFWAKNYILYALYNWGFCAILNTKEYGAIPQWCSPYGYNIFYQPNRLIVTNPNLKDIYDLEIGSECALVKLTPDFTGINDMINFYADMLALTAETAGINLINSKLSFIFKSKDKAGAESMKGMYQTLASGNPAVFIDKSLTEAGSGWEFLTQNVGQNYIADRNLADLKKWEQMFLTNIGIPNANTDKKERLISEEVNSNNIETLSLITLWKEEVQAGLDVANRLFNMNLKIDFTFDYDMLQKGGENIASNALNAGNV